MLTRLTRYFLCVLVMMMMMMSVDHYYSYCLPGYLDACLHCGGEFWAMVHGGVMRAVELRDTHGPAIG